MNVKSVLKEFQEKIDFELKQFFEENCSNIKELGEIPEKILRAAMDFTLRPGKRLRPILVVFGFKCVNSGNEREVLKASIGVELLHAYLLIHDDIMDESNVRRGLPSMHKFFEEFNKKHFGIEEQKIAVDLAILAGDLLSTYACKPLIDSSFPEKLKLRALKKLVEMNALTGFGQIIDLISETSDEFSEKNVELIHLLKTAKYTIEGPLHVGAILGNATNNQLKELSDYAIPLGKAFQIQDDILGVFGVEEKTGKPIDSDIKEGKKTLLTVKAIQNASKEEKEKLLKAIGNKNLSITEFEEVRKIIEKTGSLEYSKRKAKEFAEQALKAINKSSFKREGKEFLSALAEYIIKREY
jgi:geranylgeranyl diphosphate synthase type I